MKSKVVVLTILLFVVSSIFAVGDFTRIGTVPIPQANLNDGGIGNMISGVDIDGDGKTEMYLVNDNWNDGATEVISRIYKLEYNGTTWDSVWSAVAPVDYQNTWPQLKIADLDADGKQELVWAVINAGTSNPNRIIVYEHTTGDAFGVDTTGGYKPNSVWTITDVDGVNLRPMDMIIKDIDGDGTDEVVFADRKGADGGYYFGVCSVDDIPDNGDGSETWTLETSGKDFTLGTSIQNKWDVATIGNNMYFFDENEISKLSWNAPNYEYTELPAIPAGSPNQSAEGVDLDGDETEEIVSATYDWGTDSLKGVYITQESGDTLIHTQVADMSVYWSDSRGSWGSAYGDIDGDGKLDFIFGSRAGYNNACIFRCSYKGGDITLAASYELTIIDSAIIAEGGIWSVINVSNIDSDPELEVLYASSASYNTGGIGAPNITPPVVVLDYASTDVINEPVAPESFILINNYPNPFNPSTTIHYELTEPSQVTLQIYDVTGKKVDMLVNGSQRAEAHEIQWNPTNLSSGIYYGKIDVRNASGFQSQTVKMTYMK